MNANDSSRQRLRAVLTSPPFLLSLALLIVNDAWLKAAFPGWVSGKLSDIAGLAVVGLPLMAAWPARRWFVGGVLAALFAAWKSPLSGPLIDGVNALAAPLRFGRVVDYTDLVALAVLPVCAWAVRRPARWSLPWPTLQRLLLVPSVAATLFALVATSSLPTRQHYEVRRSALPTADELRQDRVMDAIAAVALQHGLACSNCPGGADHAGPGVPTLYRSEGLSLRCEFTMPQVVAFDIVAYPDGLFLGRSGREKADTLRAALKTMFARRFQGLEYVEPLRVGDPFEP